MKPHERYRLKHWDRENYPFETRVYHDKKEDRELLLTVFDVTTGAAEDLIGDAKLFSHLRNAAISYVYALTDGDRVAWTTDGNPFMVEAFDRENFSVDVEANVVWYMDKGSWMEKDYRADHKHAELVLDEMWRQAFRLLGESESAGACQCEITVLMNSGCLCGGR